MIPLRIGVLVTILAALGVPRLNSQSSDAVDYNATFSKLLDVTLVARCTR